MGDGAAGRSAGLPADRSAPGRARGEYAKGEMPMDNERRAILRLEHITKVFPGVKALDDVNLTLYEN